MIKEVWQSRDNPNTDSGRSPPLQRDILAVDQSFRRLLDSRVDGECGQSHRGDTLEDGPLDGDETETGRLGHVGCFERGRAELAGLVGREADISDEIRPGDTVCGGDCGSAGVKADGTSGKGCIPREGGTTGRKASPMSLAERSVLFHVRAEDAERTVGCISLR